jgi:FkbM family methyltransferase
LNSPLRPQSSVRNEASAGAVPLRYRVARQLVQRWPLRRGRSWLLRTIMKGGGGWPAHGDIPFRFGRFLGASLQPWPQGYRELYLHGVMEECETNAWRRLLRKGDTVVDGGANLGYFTMVAADAVGSQGRVYALEPCAPTAAALQRNIFASGAGNVTVVEAALWAERTRLDVVVRADDPEGIMASVAAPSAVPGDAARSCAALSLDSLAADTGAVPALVKLDVEGAELSALQGAASLLAGADPPIVTFEWNRETAARSGFQPHAVLALLARYGYVFLLAHADGFVPFVERHDVRDWSPMVWAVRPDVHNGRLRG